MAKRSLQLQTQYIQQANYAFTSKGITQENFARSLNLSRSTVSNFLRGKSIYRENFINICDVLKLDWQEITGLKVSNESNIQLTEAKENIDQQDSVNRDTQR